MDEVLQALIAALKLCAHVLGTIPRTRGQGREIEAALDAARAALAKAEEA